MEVAVFDKLKNVLIKFLPSTAKTTHEMYDSVYGGIIRTTPRSILQFDVHLAEHCNLNCRGCNNYSSLAEKEFPDINEFDRDLARMAELLHGECVYIRLTGGEPLLNPDAEKFFYIARKYFPNTNLELYTNGTLLPKMSDSFWQACRDNDIIIEMTKYPIHVDYPEIERIIVANHIRFSYLNDTNKVVKTSWLEPLDLTGRQDHRDSFFRCCKANCNIALYHGKLYTCPIIGNIRHFNKYFKLNLPVTTKDYIDIYKAKDMEEIARFLATPPPFCRFCDIRNQKLDNKWSTTKKDIKEWTL